MKKIIGVFTGNRAEYGLQYPILKAIQNHKNLDYRLIISGAHLDKKFGETIKEIKNDGFKIHARVKIEMSKYLNTFTPNAISSCVIGVAKVLSKIKPDIFLVYADRFEGFAAVIASTQMNIPTAHIEGGDITEGGALDDSVRHAMTKLSHFHFTTNLQATNRILSMGEEKWRVKTVGFPAIDLLAQGNYARKKELKSKYKIDLAKPIILFTQHSVTTEYSLSRKQLLPSLKALMSLSSKDIQIIITFPNNDVGGGIISSEFNKISSKRNPNIKIYKSIGRYNYHGFLALAKDSKQRVVCVGNSSSGIKETPFFGCPTVNIGSRQQSRLRASNVIDVNYNKDEIENAIKKCLYDKTFIKKCKAVKNPYGGGKSGEKIAKTLANITQSKKIILRKKMMIR